MSDVVSRPAVPGETCACGQPAVRVYRCGAGWVGLCHEAYTGPTAPPNENRRGHDGLLAVLLLSLLLWAALIVLVRAL